jgi:hypothetical protein
MADYWTHYYSGEELINRMDLINLDRDLFFLGCQGPDIYYYNKFAVKTNPPNLGYLIHRFKTKEIFSEIFIYLKSNNNTYLKSYIYGWIIHYVLDKNIHPYIDGKINFNHKRLESNIDTYIIDKYFNDSIFSMKSNDILTVNDKHKIIYMLYKKIGMDIFNIDISFKVYSNSIKHFNYFHKIFNQRNIFIRNGINLLFKVFKDDLNNYFYLGIDEVKLPDDIGRVDGIINNSIEESIKIIDKLKKYIKNEIKLNEVISELDDVNYLGQIIKQELKVNKRV